MITSLGKLRPDAIYYCDERLTTNCRPTIRSNLIVTTHEVKFEDFFMPFMTRLCVNWPYSNEHVLISEASAMNPVFESHIRDLANWSLGRAFKSALPALIDESVRIQDARPEQ